MPDYAAIVDALDQELIARELATRSMLDFTTMLHDDYKPGWFHRELCELLDKFAQDVQDKLSPRLIITCPPRHGKSTLSSVHFPPYLLGRNPSFEVIAATYGQTLSDEFGRKVRDLINAPLYRDLFPETQVDRRTNSANNVRTTKRGMYFATSVGGALTGLGAHALIIDDPIKSRAEAESALERKRAWDWYVSDARTRLLPGGGIIVTATRWHPDDLIGRIIAQSGEKFTLYEFPAIAVEDEPHRMKGAPLHPERYPLKELAAIRATLPPRDWESLYQCRPFLDGGDFFKSDMFRWYDTPPPGLVWYAGADYAVSESNRADYTAIVLLGVDADYNIYIHPDIYHARATPDVTTRETLRRMKMVEARTLGTEKGVIDHSIGPEFRRAMQDERWWITFSKASRSAAKHVYAAALQARMAQGKVFWPKTDFVERELVPEFLGFIPEADNKRDNLVDAVTNGILMLDEMIVPSLPEPEKELDPEDDHWKDIMARGPNKGRKVPFAKFNGDEYE